MNEKLKTIFRSIRLCVLHCITAFLLLFLFSTTGAFAQTTVNSLTALIPYLDDNNANVKLASGTYTVTANDVNNGVYNTQINHNNKVVLFMFEGSNSTYDFTGVTIEVETAVLSSFGNVDVIEFNINGNNNVLKNLKLVDVGSVHDAPGRGAVNIVIDGENNVVEGFDVESRGSSPYGYGDIFGKGGGPLVPLNKHSGILIRGNYNTLKNTKIFHRAFGHCVFMQAASNPTIDGCYIQGEIRTTDDILTETGTIADDLNFMTIWGYTLPSGFTLALCEAGIRSYNAGSTLVNGVTLDRGSNDITVNNTTVINTRSGCTISQASGSRTVTNCTLIGNESGYAIGSGTITNCTADAAYGPAFDGGSGITANMTLIEPANGYHNGSGAVASVTGADLTLNSNGVNVPSNLSIKMGTIRDLRHQVGGTLDYQLTTSFSGATVNNLTNAAIELGSGASNNSITTCGSVTNNGSGNSISTASNCPAVGTNNIAQGKTASQSSSYSTSSGLAHEAVDGNTNGAWSGGSVTHTQANTSNPWWEVDLGGTYDIDDIVLFNRTDNCCKARLSNFTVSVKNGNTTTFSQTFSSYPDPSRTVNAGNASGDVIRVQINGTGTLSLAEVEVYGTASATTSGGGDFQLVKRNATGFVIDGGGNNGAEGRSVELYTYVQHNNLTWTEISRGGGYYSYQKRNSNVCFDGGDGGGNGQDVTLEVCDANDQNQHWLKIDAGNGHYRLEKRGTNFSLDGGGGGAIDQNVYLWTSNSSNQNQQWRFDNASSSRTIDGDIEDELAQKSALKIYPNPIVTDALTIEMENGVYNQFSIYNINGSIVRQGAITSELNQLSVDFSDLNRGVYILMLSERGGYKTFKIAKE